MELEQIKIKLARATTLPILPNVVAEVLRLTQDPNAGTREFEKAISQDAAMTAKVLRTANSASYAGSGQITNLQRALAQLGTKTIRSICVAAGFQSATTSKLLNSRFHAARFWQHSLAVACAAKLLAKLAKSPFSEEAFIAGLVHDIGKLAICMFLTTEADAIYDLVDKQQLSHFQAEQEVLSVTHQEIGRLAAEHWGLPDMFFAPIASHHCPRSENGEINPLTACVHVANALAYDMGLSFSPPGAMSVVDAEVVTFLGIPEEQYGPICLAVGKEVQNLSQHIGL